MAKTSKDVSEMDIKNTKTEIENPVAERTEIPIPPPTEPEAPGETDIKPMYNGITHFAYVGVSLPNGRLKSNAVLCGTYAEITEYYKETIALYPGLEKLIVPVSRLAESREKIKNGGNLFNKYNQDIAAAIKAKAEQEGVRE